MGRQRAAGSAARLIAFQHRLAGLTGHRFNQALGLVAAAPRRGMEALLLMHQEATAEVRAALPGRAVLHDPVFRPDWSCDARTADFVAMLHRHLDGEVRQDDRLLITVATQCEARALAAWLAALPARRRPWTLVLFPSDRWNRGTAAERERQVREFDVLAGELAVAAPEVLRRLIWCSHAAGLCAELGGLLGMPVLQAPMTELADDLEPAGLPSRGLPLDAGGPGHGPPRVGVLGGARPEKGTHLLPAIVHECRRLVAVDFVLQLANETLPPEEFARLCRLGGEPGISTAAGPLDRPAYLELLAGSDLVLFPYQRIPYRQRASGVLSEVVLAGRPVVVPSGTWLAEQVAAGRAAGVAYDGDDAASIAAAVARGLAELPALASQAGARAPAWRRDNSLDAFLDWLEAEIAGRRERAPDQRARSGASRQLVSWRRRLRASIRAWARG